MLEFFGACENFDRHAHGSRRLFVRCEVSFPGLFRIDRADFPTLWR